MEQAFYRGFVERVRGIAEKADPSARRRLLDLANAVRCESRSGLSIRRS